MWNDVVFVLFFFLPAAIANVTPIIVAKLPVLRDWNYPLDCYGTFRGKRILGDHKTWRGLVVGVTVGTLLPLSVYSLFATRDMFWEVFLVWFGLICFFQSLGALVGDAVKSFLKRQFGIPSGSSWFLWDQIDYILGAIIFVCWLYPLTIGQVLLAILTWGCISLIFSYIGYQTKFKKEPI